MAAPVISLKVNTGTEGTPVWTTVGSTEVITFTGSGSSNGNLKPIPAPTGSNKVRIADELWINKATDQQISLYDGGGQEVSSYSTDMFPTTNPSNTNIFAIQADTNPETAAGVLEAWDDINYNTTATEILNGTSNLGVHSQLRACETSNNVAPSAGAGSMPAGYQSQTAQTTTYQLQGSTRKITFSGALSAGNQNRFPLHLFVVDDSTAGADSVELTYLYTYT